MGHPILRGKTRDTPLSLFKLILKPASTSFKFPCMHKFIILIVFLNIFGWILNHNLGWKSRRELSIRAKTYHKWKSLPFRNTQGRWVLRIRQFLSQKPLSLTKSASPVLSWLQYCRAHLNTHPYSLNWKRENENVINYTQREISTFANGLKMHLQPEFPPAGAEAEVACEKAGR